jgi:hypothetical protein
MRCCCGLLLAERETRKQTAVLEVGGEGEEDVLYKQSLYN